MIYKWTIFWIYTNKIHPTGICVTFMHERKWICWLITLVNSSYVCIWYIKRNMDVILQLTCIILLYRPPRPNVYHLCFNIWYINGKKNSQLSNHILGDCSPGALSLIPAFIVSLFHTIHLILQYVYTVNNVIGCNLPLLDIHTTEH